MVTRQSASSRRQIEEKVFSPQEIERGIEKLRRRISDIRKLNPQELGAEDAQIETAQKYDLGYS